MYPAGAGVETGVETAVVCPNGEMWAEVGSEVETEAEGNV